MVTCAPAPDYLRLAARRVEVDTGPSHVATRCSTHVPPCATLAGGRNGPVEREALLHQERAHRGGGRQARWRHGQGANPPLLTSALGLRPPLPHLHRDWAHPSHSCTATGLTPPTSAPGLGSPLPYLHRDWAHPSHICTGTWPTPAHICTGTGPIPPTAAPRRGSRLPHLHRDWARPERQAE
jgi:hypothetical protein